MPSPGRQDRIRQSWQRREISGTPARVWLIVRRAVATLIALALIGVCVWVVAGLLFVSNTHFAYWTASMYEPLGGQPIAFVTADFQAIKVLEPAFNESDLPEPLKDPLTREVLEKHLGEVSAWDMSGKDTLIVYLTVHGVVRGNQARLQCEPGEAGTEATLPVSALLDALKSVSAGTKLLILDAGRDHYNPRFGMKLNTFPELLKSAVQKTNDSRLWVLSANAPLERSHVSVSRRRSVFGHVLSSGLRGLADKNSDQTIRLDELYNYVQNGVLDWTKKTTDGRETQTPMLFHCEPEKLERQRLAEVFVLSTRRLPADATEDSGQESLALDELAAERADELAPASVKSAADRLEGGAEPSGEGTAASEGDGKTREGGGDSGSATTGTDYAVRAQQRRRAAWQLASAIQSAPAGPSPGIIVPPLWQSSVDELLWYDYFCTADIPAKQATQWKPAIQDLDRIHESLKSFAQTGALTSAGITQRDVPTESISLAVAERLAASGSDEAHAKEISTLASSYDAWLAAGEKSSFATLDALASPKGGGEEEKIAPIETQKHFSEFQLLHFLRYADVPWQLVRSVLQTRRLAERVAADPLCGEGWAQDAIRQADQLRCKGERLILDQTHTNWPGDSSEILADATSRYERAAQDLKLVNDVLQKRNRLLARAPQYVRWAHLNRGEGKEATVAVAKLLATLRAVSNALTKPTREGISELESLERILDEAHEELEKRLVSARDPGQIENLLDTTLPDATLREQLYARWAAEERKRAPEDATIDSATVATWSGELTDQQRSQVRDQLQLEIELARLAGCDEAEIGKLSKSLEDPKTDLLGFEAVANDVAALYSDTLKSIISRFESVNSATAAASRSQLADLRNKTCHWLLVAGAFHDEANTMNRVVTALNQAAWHDMLLWQSARSRWAANDAPGVEVAYLRSTAENYRRLASTFPGPGAAAAGQRSPQFESTASISLVTTDSIRLPFKLRTAARVPARLVAQFNSQLLRISGDVPSKSADYPVDPNSPIVTATAPLAAGQVTSATIQVDRLPSARGTTKLILKAISGDTIVRHEVEVELPGRELLDVTVNAGREFWSPTNEGLVLHPLPNQLQDFSFNIVNRSNVAKELEASFFIRLEPPRGNTPVVIPSGAQRKETASKLLDAFGPRAPLGPAMPIKFESGQSSARLALDPKGDAVANLLLTGKEEDPAKFPGLPLQNGLLLVLTDTKSEEVTIRQIKIMPQRPRRYIRALGQYNQSTRRFQIDVAALNQNVVPPKGLPVSLNVDESSISSARDKDDHGILTSPDYAKSLYVHLANNAPPEVRASVDVDGFPRAFIFRVSPYASAENIPPVDDAMAVRIVSPPPRTAYRAPAGRVPVELEVDAPEGSFSRDDGTCYVDIGLDWDQDGQFRNEQYERLRSDRQVEVRAKSLSPNGTLKLDTRVSDFKLRVRASGSNKEADLRAQLVTPLDSRPSDTVPIRLDGAGPVIHAQLRPGREIESGSELEVRVFTDPPDLSGVKKVEAVFESSVSSGAEAAWEVAKPSEGSTWTAMLKTAGLPVGPHTVLIRAEDVVGNKSEGRPQALVIVRKQAAAASPGSGAAPDVSNNVSGRVLYGNQGVAAQLELVPQAGAATVRGVSKADGSFFISKVPPGAYNLKAASIEAVRNRKRTAEIPITVPPRPQRLVPITVSLQ